MRDRSKRETVIETKEFKNAPLLAFMPDNMAVVFVDGTISAGEITDCVKHDYPLKHVKDLAENHREFLYAPSGSTANVTIEKVQALGTYERISIKDIRIGGTSQ